MGSLVSRRFLLSALLAAATLLFSVGVNAERSSADDHAGPAVAASAESGEEGHSEEGAEATHSESESESASQPAGSGDAHSEDEQLLGIGLESTPLIVLALLGGFALAAAAASDLRHRRAFLVVVAVIALAWAALDVRELLHQIDESREGIAAIAAAVALLHLLAGVVAARAANSVSDAPA